MYIYVSLCGSGVMGFSPKEIADFEAEYETVKPYASYWGYFNWYFEDVLEGRTATGYSYLWRNNEAYAELNKLRSFII